jgi:hypothetical protein
VTAAGRAGSDAAGPAALAHTLTNAFQAIWVPDKLQERQRLADEVVELAQRLDDPLFRP